MIVFSMALQRRGWRPGTTGFLAFLLALGTGVQAAMVEFLTIEPGSSLPLPAKLFRPEPAGRFPAVIVLHGSGGLWHNDDPVPGLLGRHFEEWGQLLADSGYVALFVDSYTPRGLKEFRSRRPAADPALDDSACSPAYGRPWDALRALGCLQARQDIRPDRIALVGFSQGAETALSSVVSRSVTKTNWTVSYLDTNGVSRPIAVPGPARLGPQATGFRVVIAFYPGCGFYGYYGSPGSTETNLYLPYAPALILHGAADPLYADSLYPEKLVGKSEAQATATALGFNPLQLAVYPGAHHSFDEDELGPEPALDTPDQAAKRAGRALAVQWLEVFLKQPSLEARPASPGRVEAYWPGGVGVSYQIETTADFSSWQLGPVVGVTRTGDEARFDLLPAAYGPQRFLRVRAQLPAPF